MKGISEAWGSYKQGVRCALWLAAVVAVLSAAPVKAQFVESEFRASDGTAYQVLRLLPTLPNGAEKQRVTTLSGSSDGIGGCNSLGNAPGQVAAAVAGALPPLQLLHPLDHARRSAVLVPNSLSITFDITNNNLSPRLADTLALGLDARRARRVEACGYSSFGTSSARLSGTRDQGATSTTVHTEPDPVLARTCRSPSRRRERSSAPAASSSSWCPVGEVVVVDAGPVRLHVGPCRRRGSAIHFHTTMHYQSQPTTRPA
jgi:hypothetical protein